MTDITENDVYRVLSYIKWKIPLDIKSEIRDRRKPKDPLPDLLDDPIFKKVDAYIQSLADQGFIETRDGENGEIQYRLRNKVKKD
jgi:hypothetical protein